MSTISLISLLGCIALISLFQRTIHVVATAGLDALLQVLDGLRSWLTEARHSLRLVLARLLSDIGLGEGRMRTTYLIGAAGAAVAASFLGTCEAAMVIYAAEALFNTTVSTRLPPVLRSVEGLLTGGLLGAGLIAVWAYKGFAADSRTRLIVLDWYAPSARTLLRRCAGAAAISVLVSVVGLAVVRSLALDESERVEAPGPGARPESSDSYQEVLRATRWAVGVSSTLGFALAGVPTFAVAYDGAQFAPPVAVAAAHAVVSIAGWVISAAAGLTRGIRLLISLVLQAIAWVGNPLTRWLVELLRRLHQWAEERPESRGTGRALRGFVGALTAMGHDFQVPDSEQRPWADT